MSDDASLAWAAAATACGIATLAGFAYCGYVLLSSYEANRFSAMCRQVGGINERTDRGDRICILKTIRDKKSAT